MQRHRYLFILFIVGALSALACGTLDIGGADPTEEWNPASTAEANGDSGPVVVTAAPSVDVGVIELVDAPAGLACLGTSNGLSCIMPDGSWQTLTSDNSGLGFDTVYASTTCADGSFLFAHVSGVNRFDGTDWDEVADDWDGGSADAVACGNENDIWVAHFEGVSRYSNNSWQTFPSNNLSTGETATDLVEGVVVQGDGTVWVGTAASAATFDGAAWTIYQEGQGMVERLFIDDIVVAPDGTVWLGHSRGISSFVDGAWQQIDFPNIGTSVEGIAVDANNQVWVATLSDGVLVYTEGVWGSYTSESGDLPDNHVQDIAVDARGRVWAATIYGLSVNAGDGWVTYQMHTADMVDNDIDNIAIVAGGPETLPPLVPLANGELTGRLLAADGVTPIADATIEICVGTVSSFFSDGGAPCEGEPFILTTTTDDTGRFRITDIPPGRYNITASYAKGVWAMLTGDFGFNEDVYIGPDVPTDLGELVLESDE